jgi:hypothetical protein
MEGVGDGDWIGRRDDSLFLFPFCFVSLSAFCLHDTQD